MIFVTKARHEAALNSLHADIWELQDRYYELKGGYARLLSYLNLQEKHIAERIEIAPDDRATFS